MFVNNGGSSTLYNNVTRYDGHSKSQTVTISDDGLSSGVIYKFKYRAINIYGYSDWSEDLNAGLSSFPVKPNPVR